MWIFAGIFSFNSSYRFVDASSKWLCPFWSLWRIWGFSSLLGVLAIFWHTFHFMFLSANIEHHFSSIVNSRKIFSPGGNTFKNLEMEKNIISLPISLSDYCLYLVENMKIQLWYTWLLRYSVSFYESSEFLGNSSKIAFVWFSFEMVVAIVTILLCQFVVTIVRGVSFGLESHTSKVI